MKKNFNKIPKDILAKIETFDVKDIEVSCVKELNLEKIKIGEYVDWGICFIDGEVVCKSFIPERSNGRYSRRNLNGEIIIRKDLPKYEKTFSFEAPNFGDYSKGTHTVERTREVYHRDFVAPKELEIKSELLEKKENGFCIIKISVEEVLDATDIENDVFLKNLLFNINLLQENVGAINIFRSSSTREEYLNSIYINWEILPPGSRDEVLRNIISKFRNPNSFVKTAITDRYNFLLPFNPIFIVGGSGFRRYFGAKLRDDLVIFENIEYGNAIYVMFENWEELSKLSRIELLKDNDGKKFIRIIHKEFWKNRLMAVIKK